jgi:hypothetical protein
MTTGVQQCSMEPGVSGILTGVQQWNMEPGVSGMTTGVQQWNMEPGVESVGDNDWSTAVEHGAWSRECRG